MNRLACPGTNSIKYHMQMQVLPLDATRDLQDSSRVHTEFDSLEKKVAQFIALCERLRDENSDLRRQLTAAQHDSKQLTEKVEGARQRIELLLSRLPD